MNIHKEGQRYYSHVTLVALGSKVHCFNISLYTHLFCQYLILGLCVSLDSSVAQVNMKAMDYHTKTSIEIIYFTGYCMSMLTGHPSVAQTELNHRTFVNRNEC